MKLSEMLRKQAMRYYADVDEATTTAGHMTQVEFMRFISKLLRRADQLMKRADELECPFCADEVPNHYPECIVISERPWAM